MKLIFKLILHIDLAWSQSVSVEVLLFEVIGVLDQLLIAITQNVLIMLGSYWPWRLDVVVWMRFLIFILKKNFLVSQWWQILNILVCLVTLCLKNL